MELRPREPRIRGNDTVLLEIEIKPLEPASGRTREPEETERLEDLRERAQRGNPFRLDANGQLRILGVAPIPLAGLTEAQATERLIRDPVLRDFDVKLTLLPLEKLDAEALQAVRLRPLRGRALDLCAGHRRARALRVRGWTRRPPRSAADRQHQGPSLAGRPRSPTRCSRAAASSPSARCATSS
jgi:hypothetical protein